MKGVILTAGEIGKSLSPIFGSIPTGLTPVNGKPIIFFIIENFLSQGVSDIYIGVDFQSEYLEKIVSTFFSRKANLKFVKVDKNKGPGDSLVTVLQCVSNGSVIVNLADTIARYDAKECIESNCVVVSSCVESSEKWCLVEVENDTGNIIAFHEKEMDIEPANGAVGVYVLHDVEMFQDFSGKKTRNEISDVILWAMRSRPFKVIHATEWLDFGHIEQYQIAKKRMLSARVFNSLEFDELVGTVTKKSKNVDKFVDEIRWQLNLPDTLKALFPRIISSDIHTNAPFITMEYYSYQSLAELWLYSSFGHQTLFAMLKKVIRILDVFKRFPLPVSRKSHDAALVLKTKERVDALLANNVFFTEVFESYDVFINGRKYRNWGSLKNDVFALVDEMYSPEHHFLMHGDLCFSNILYDVNGGIVRLIDPRGSWGGSLGGDVRYDIAKLRHSVSGNYDFIVNDLFCVKTEGGYFEYEIFCQPHHVSVAKAFDDLISYQYRLRDIKLIEGLLFLSMLPLHSDNENRQMMMYCRAVELLNEAVS